MPEERKSADEDIFLMDDEGENTQENRFLLFNLGSEVYGIPIIHVINIIELQKITEVPDMPDYIKGVINLRGSVIPVMDLRLRFGLGARVYDDRTCIIIVRLEDKSIGFIVDTVAEVQDILPKDIDPPVQFKDTEARAQYIAGMGKVGAEVKILLDIFKVVNERDLAKAV